MYYRLAGYFRTFIFVVFENSRSRTQHEKLNHKTSLFESYQIDPRINLNPLYGMVVVVRDTMKIPQASKHWSLPTYIGDSIYLMHMFSNVSLVALSCNMF